MLLRVTPSKYSMEDVGYFGFIFVIFFSSKIESIFVRGAANFFVHMAAITLILALQADFNAWFAPES